MGWLSGVIVSHNIEIINKVKKSNSLLRRYVPSGRLSGPTENPFFLFFFTGGSVALPSGCFSVSRDRLVDMMNGNVYAIVLVDVLVVMEGNFRDDLRSFFPKAVRREVAISGGTNSSSSN